MVKDITMFKHKNSTSLQTNISLCYKNEKVTLKKKPHLNVINLWVCSFFLALIFYKISYYV